MTEIAAAEVLYPALFPLSAGIKAIAGPPGGSLMHLFPDFPGDGRRILSQHPGNLLKGATFSEELLKGYPFSISKEV